MKKIRLLIVLCSFISIAQAQEQLDCDFNLREAIFYLQGDENFKRDTVAYITKLPFIPPKRSDKQIKVTRINTLAKI